MRVVIDTNVLVSAALKNRDPETVIKWIVAHPDWLWLATTEILSEYKAVLSRPRFGLPRQLLNQWFELLDAATTPVVADIVTNYPRDQKDAVFLACALVAEADYLITGDKDFTDARKLLTTTILSVSQFKRIVCDTVP